MAGAFCPERGFVDRIDEHHSIVCTGGSGWVGRTAGFAAGAAASGFFSSGGDGAAGLVSTGAGVGGACAVSGRGGADCGRGFGVTSGASAGARLATRGTGAGGRMSLRPSDGGGNVGP